MLRKILALMIFAVALFTYAKVSDKNKGTYYIDDKPQSIVLKKDQKTFSITLKANPTTGYIWSVNKLDKAYIELVKEERIKLQDPKLMGAPSQKKYVFKLKQPLADKSTLIVLKYARSWEKDGETYRTFKITQGSGK